VYWTYLGLINYKKALKIQHHIRESLLNKKGEETLLTLEHNPVITLGKSAKIKDLLLPLDKLYSLGIDIEYTDRGGQITYHGPGQLVGYPIIKLSKNKGIKWFLEIIGRSLKEVLKKYNVPSYWNKEKIGLWVQDKKIASIGINIHRRVTTHGFALNVNSDLRCFDYIIPCGLKGVRFISLKEILKREIPLEEIARKTSEILIKYLEREPCFRPASMFL
jgi:lipoate-protein ligase B